MAAGTNAAFGLLGDNEAAVLHDRASFSSLGMRVGVAEVGAVWPKRFSEGRDYLSVKLDDPSFNAPIYANLFDDKDAETYTLIWSRSRKPYGD